MSKFSQGRVPQKDPKPLISEMKKVETIGQITIFKSEKSKVAFWCIKGSLILLGPTTHLGAEMWASGFRVGQNWK